MKAARLLKPHVFELVSVPDPVPREDEVIIRVIACGVCRGDFNKWNGISDQYPREPGSSGHEVYGTIEELGSKVENLKIGDTVSSIRFPGKGFAELALATAKHVSRVPGELKNDVILGEPLACAVNAIGRAKIKPGDSVLIVGIGFMGALALKLLTISGAAPLIAVDISEFSRDLARRIGADFVFDPQDTRSIDKIKKLVGADGLNCVVEATGTQEALDYCTEAVSVRGTLVIYGYHVDNRRSINMQLWNWKGIDVVNAHERDQDNYFRGMLKAFNLLKYNKLTFDLITHEFDLDAINDCFQFIRKRPPGYIKAVIKP
ncbi:MAG: zinc-binding dehydrogenase [Spirochaetaceae bacterium]|nr:MAG: zinc-binding dehydrogenase [Spirochaetaceae bacterium]